MREILCISSSLTSCDPGDVFTTLASLKRDRVRVCIIGLSASVSLCARIAKETMGTYFVVLNQPHFRKLLWTAVEPPATSADDGVTRTAPASVFMGFPKTLVLSQAVLCAWFVFYISNGVSFIILSGKKVTKPRCKGYTSVRGASRVYAESP